MCYDTNARPPYAPGPAGKAEGKDLELVSDDGTRFLAYQAQPVDAQAHARILIYPDVRGLHGFYKDLACRFAEKGVQALAIDYFGRTAGTGTRDESFEFMPHVQQMTWPSLLSDARAALQHLGREGAAGTPRFVLGFCMGGALSLLTGTEDLGLNGVIAFYPGLSRQFPGRQGTALDNADRIRVPVLGLFGGADQGIPASAVAELDTALDSAGVAHELKTYPGAPHSFFDRKASEFASESRDAWERALAFISSHTTTG